MNKNRFDAQKSSLVFLLAFLFAQIGLSIWQTILKSILKACHYSNVEHYTSNAWLYMLFALAQLLIFVGIFAICYKKFNLKAEIKQEKLNPKWFVIFMLFGVVAMFALSPFINLFSTFLNLLGKPSSGLSYSLDNWQNYLLSLISLAVFPAIGEELLFRGAIFNGLKSKGKLFAVVMSSVMFSIFHFNLSQLYYPLLFGMLLGLAYAYTDNLWVPIGMHFLNNALNLTIQFAFKTSSSSISIVAIIIGAVIYLGILFFCLYLASKKDNTEDITESKSSTELKKENFHIAWPILIMIFFYIALISIT